MELIKFRITNFRSINDSGDVTVSKLTSLVGRNESGKSNLLLGLATLNPSGGRKPLNKIKDFPRGRRLEECKDNTPVVASRWKLSPAELTQSARRWAAMAALSQRWELYATTSRPLGSTWWLPGPPLRKAKWKAYCGG
jgi:hypothetical protein